MIYNRHKIPIFLTGAFIIFIIPAIAYAQQVGVKDQARTYREEGYKLQSIGNFREALMLYQKAVQLDPSNAEIYNDLGVIYESMGNESQALKSYVKSIQIDPNCLAAYTNLAFFYEKKNDAQNASYYWERRYELGSPGEYWREVAQQHLLALGVYPRIKKQQIEKQAINLSKELVYRHEQERLKTIDEARQHFDMGYSLFLKGDYAGSLKEFETALSLNPSDGALVEKINGLYKKTKIIVMKDNALSLAQEAMDCIKRDDFLSGGVKLKEALAAVFQAEAETKPPESSTMLSQEQQKKK
jgi:tetratricopeptide (TPR) repeat protein